MTSPHLIRKLYRPAKTTGCSPLGGAIPHVVMCSIDHHFQPGKEHRRVSGGVRKKGFPEANATRPVG